MAWSDAKFDSTIAGFLRCVAKLAGAHVGAKSVTDGEENNTDVPTEGKEAGEEEAGRYGMRLVRSSSQVIARARNNGPLEAVFEYRKKRLGECYDRYMDETNHVHFEEKECGQLLQLRPAVTSIGSWLEDILDKEDAQDTMHPDWDGNCFRDGFINYFLEVWHGGMASISDMDFDLTIKMFDVTSRAAEAWRRADKTLQTALVFEAGLSHSIYSKVQHRQTRDELSRINEELQGLQSQALALSTDRLQLSLAAIFQVIHQQRQFVLIDDVRQLIIYHETMQQNEIVPRESSRRSDNERGSKVPQSGENSRVEPKEFQRFFLEDYCGGLQKMMEEESELILKLFMTAAVTIRNDQMFEFGHEEQQLTVEEAMGEQDNRGEIDWANTTAHAKFKRSILKLKVGAALQRAST